VLGWRTYHTPNGEKEKCDMKTRKNKGSNMESNEAITRFASVNGITYLCCNYCERPMVKSWVCVWTEYKDGHKLNTNFLHYHCRESFESENANRGTWLSRGWRGWSITW
jgi:hypothetical protein